MSKKIAFVMFGHTASTFPLIKRLCDLGYFVDAYYICKRNIHYIEGFEELNIQLNKRIQLLGKDKLSKVYSYVNSDKFRFFGVSFSDDYMKYKLINYLLTPYLKWQYRCLCEHLNKERYDLINIITRVNVVANEELVKSLKSKVLLSLHEVYNHYNEIKSNSVVQIPSIYKVAEKKKCNIVVFSQNSKTYLIGLGLNPNRISVINFGLFETYDMIVPEAPCCKLPDNYGLFFGMIKPYKGLNILYDAVLKNNLKNKDRKYVIAGSGDDPILSQINSSEKFVVLNKYLSSSELVYLIRHCRYLICPYTTMSQSGIPQTAFVFHKPIIASDLEGFKEIIKDGENGFLFVSKDSKSLAEAMEKIENEEVYTNLVTGIKSFSSKYKEFDWKEIADIFARKYL